MKRRILARSEYWHDERRMSDAAARLRFVRESVALSTFNIAQDIEGEECAIGHVSYYRISSGELAPPASDDGVIERVFDELAETELTVHPGYAPWLPEFPPDRYRFGLDEYDKGYKVASSLGYSERDVIMGVARRYGGLNAAELGAVARETRAYKRSSPGEIKFSRSEDVIARERWANEQPGMAEFMAEALAALAEMDGKEWIIDDELMRGFGESERGA